MSGDEPLSKLAYVAQYVNIRSAIFLVYDDDGVGYASSYIVDRFYRRAYRHTLTKIRKEAQVCYALPQEFINPS